METIFWRNYTRLCEARWESPCAVASELGITSASVTGWKKGTMPRTGTLKKIAEHFSVALQDLVDGEPAEPKPDPKITMQERIDEAAKILVRIMRQYEEMRDGFEITASEAVSAAAALAELAKATTK